MEDGEITPPPIEANLDIVDEEGYIGGMEESIGDEEEYECGEDYESGKIFQYTKCIHDSLQKETTCKKSALIITKT